MGIHGSSRKRSLHDSRNQVYPRTPKHRKRDRILAIAAVVLCSLGIVLGITIGFGFDFYDARHQIPVQCDVTEANAGSGPRMGNIVVVQTSDCGWLNLRGVGTEDQAAWEGEKLKPGHRYRFEMGAASHTFEPFVRFIHDRPNVYSFQEVGC